MKVYNNEKLYSQFLKARYHDWLVDQWDSKAFELKALSQTITDVSDYVARLNELQNEIISVNVTSTAKEETE